MDRIPPLRFQAAISPRGAIGIVAAQEDDVAFGQGGEVSQSLTDSFQQSTLAGLTWLASANCEPHLPISIQFWRRFAEQYFKALCRQPAAKMEHWATPQCPSDETLGETLDAAPPMPGLEYASIDLLKSLWKGLDEFTRAAVTKTPGGLASYLHSLRPNWNLVGRVTFHLAENKKNPELPFAFLATYTAGQSHSGAIQHIPLSTALQQSIVAKDSVQLDRLLEPVSQAAKSIKLINQMLESRALFAPQAWGIKQAFEFLTHVPQMEEAGVIVRVPNWWNASKPPRPQVQVQIGSKRQSMLGGIQGMDLKVDVTIDGEELNSDELAQLMAAREGLTLLRGKWVHVNQDQLQSALTQWQRLQKEHVTGLSFLEGMRLLSGATMGQDVVDEPLRNQTRIEPGPWLKEMLDTLRDPSGKIKLDPQQRLNATLRPYQADGVRWLWFATQLGFGVCLADDMGLGKTIQMLALLLQLKYPADLATTKSKPKQQPSTTTPSLLILPTSLLGNWQREVERFAPDLRLFVAHRSMCEPADLKRVADNPAEQLADYDLVATTYGLARREKWLGKVNWRLVILDEAQAIKNSGAAQTKAIKSIPSQGRIILSGTPVENHLGDLWSLFDFCSPGLLGTATEFKKFVKADDDKTLTKRLSAVRRLIRPYVLRRMKTDPKIVPDLPDKTEMRVDCGLTTTQAALYRKVVAELEQALDLATGIQRRGMVLAALMQLKQICNHPALYLKQTDFADEASGKFNELLTICQTLIEKQEKLLVFSQFQSMCDPLNQFLQRAFGTPGLVLTGKTAPAARNKLVHQFQQEFGPPYFVISVKAGGTGLNLTQASHVVHFDRWWNPAVEDQATDRAFRIGQKRNVLVHKFVCRGTLEDKIDDQIQFKKHLSQELFGSDGEIHLTEMSNDQLLDFVALDINKASTV